MASRKNIHTKDNLIAQNRKARFNYEILSTIEAGIMLTGPEVKSLRLGKVSINEAHAGEESGDIYLFNFYIEEYDNAGRETHRPRRPKKLLLHKREISKLIGLSYQQGLTLVPLKVYFNGKGLVKIELATAKGKKIHDKRETEKNRSWQRDKQRLLKQLN
ncbi:SsrA-binding protein SmpB [Hyphomicrobiales bacterium]|jgi:SsrA-binding protein|nr:SsrA-binding protein SmpB [Rhodobiaceae bacterium]MDB4128347.1 SsrA-binding protein SmpB [Hyphomicrobiales bacterium]MBT5640232.1 SsrA-binding protein SmpB [Rhodobiaceae bacterium]MBT6222554.1 SsrA-binding protein SmpB [Rhodobiaceae bacterium]MDC0139939.1 SsrA-binding protein SmpB [Hyphomicrobiales bacterium]|tara:strand:+ start:137 stop:616 length:480 start_codon:yes stop_codon:yes gene_type:complete